MNKDYYEYTISKQFLQIIVNNDFTDLNLDEESDLDLFLEGIKGYQYVSYDDEDLYNTDFKKCDILKLYSDCIKIEVYF